jgi:superfamily II DNA or RNA helicase
MQYRDYQTRINLAQDQFMADPDRQRATILATPGSGKTVCFTNAIVNLINTNPKCRILVVHPRLALSSDQQGRLKADLAGLTVEFTSFHSGDTYNVSADRVGKSTTDPVELERLRNTTAGAHITFASYKSLYRILDAQLDFDMTVCDEAHTLVQSDMRANLHKFRGKVLFYTGTPIRVVAQEESMDNPELFGEVLTNVPPSELIPNRYIVAPTVRILNATTKRQGTAVDYPTTIAYAYKDQLAQVNPLFNHKMLVAMANTEFFEEITEKLAEMREIVGDYNMDLYYVTADCAAKNGATRYGSAGRVAILEDFEHNPNHAIIIHCDTLAEGIDIDGIGGELILRNMSMSKGIQTICRGSRPAKEDKLDNAEIREDRIKTQNIVTLVRVDGEWISGTKTVDYVELFKLAGYGNLWDLVDPECRESVRSKLDPEDTGEEPVWDEIKDIQVKALGAELGEELFGTDSQPA